MVAANRAAVDLLHSYSATFAATTARSRPPSEESRRSYALVHFGARRRDDLANHSHPSNERRATSAPCRAPRAVLEESRSQDPWTEESPEAARHTGSRGPENARRIAPCLQKLDYSAAGDVAGTRALPRRSHPPVAACYTHERAE